MPRIYTFPVDPELQEKWVIAVKMMTDTLGQLQTLR